VLGPATTAFTNGSDRAVPAVTDSGTLKLVRSSGTELLVSGDDPAAPRTSKSLLAVSSFGAGETAVVYADANSETLYRVTPTAGPTALAQPDSGAQAVAGSGDIDGDGDAELVFADSSQAIRYVESGDDTTQAFTKAYDGAGSNNGIGVGPPADFTGDGVDSVPIVDGSNQVLLVGADGVRATLTQGGAAKSPVLPADLDADGTPELVFLATNGSVMRIDDVGGAATVKTVGILSGETAPFDLGAAAIANMLGFFSNVSADTDGDLILNLREGIVDTDSDGTPDYRDTDDDGDGISTRTEALDGQNYSHDVDFDEIVNWLDTDADGDGVADSAEGTNDSDGDGMPDYLDNDLDNDGLPDSYERNVSKTDPRNNDSESNATNDTVADNGIIDGIEDFDSDRLGNYIEYAIGTDPFARDTDGDSLGDGFEYRNSQFDPLAKDTDGDGVSDGEADIDGDGLNNTQEAELGTLVDRPDTDRDSLTDSHEVELGTDPTLPDTDADGLTDDEELELGTDPLVEDTDGDSVLDGNETVETTMTNNETDATVTLRAEGTTGNVTIEAKPDFFQNTSASAGPTVQLENRTAFENATVELPVDASVPESEYENLSIYTWNGSSKDTWSKVETTIESGTAKATVEHFSYFTVLDTDEWVSATNVGVGDPIDLNASDSFRCRDACNLTANETVVLGGEPTTRKITVEQGSDTYKMVPLSNGQTIENFYDYGNAEINSPLPVAKSDTSRLFFWSGPSGLSLVSLQDEPRDGSGAAVTLEFDGLPTGSGSWVVQDDPGSNSADSYGTTPDWTWTDDNTDGGAFRGGLTNTTITVTPKFNEQASKEPLTPGQITDWEILSGRATDPNNGSLATDQSITITVPGDPDEDSSGSVSGDTGNANVTHGLTPGTDTLVVVYQTEQTNVEPSASIKVTGASGTTVSKDLAIGTVGTVQTTLNVSTLAHSDANVSLSADGVNMRAQVVPRETFDSDGDGIRDAVEEQVWTLPTATGSVFSTDPYNADTDGDGVPDGEEVIYKTKADSGTLTASIAVANSDPTEVNSDEDELTDPEENRGWNTYLARSPSTAEQFVSARQSGGNPRGVLWEQNVSSDPFSTDTDGDYLDDDEERRLGTSPTVVDSDRDGNDDYYEVSGDYDPTIHDHKAPLIEPLKISANDNRTDYTVTVTVSDQSGVHLTEFYKAGKLQWGALGDNETAKTLTADIEVDRGFFERHKKVVEAFFKPVTVDASTTDTHGNRKRKELSGPDTFGQAADKYANFPGSPGKNGFVTRMGFSSGASTVVGETVAGLIEIVTDPLGYAEQMAQLGAMIADNPAILSELPAMMADQLREQHQARNPFDPGDQFYDEFAGGWSLGYATGIVAPAAATGGGSVLQKGLSSSSKLQRLVNAAGSAVPDSVPGGVRPAALLRAGKVTDAVDASVPTGRMSAKLNDMPGPRRQQVTQQFAQLDSNGNDYLGSTDIDDASLKAADLFENAGPGGRTALNALADGDPDAADVLLEMDDAATQWRFTRAYQGDAVDGEELGTALNRYDELDADEKAVARQAMARSNTDAVRLMRTDVCNSPCDGVLKSIEDFVDSRSGLDQGALNKLVGAFEDSDDIPEDVPGEEPGTVAEDLEYLDDQGVDQLDETIDSISGDQSGYTGLAGETRTARRVIENNDNADVEMETTVDPDNIADEDLPDGVTRDDLKDGPTDIDVNNRNGAAWESKNTEQYTPLYPDEGEYEQVGRRLNDLRKKLNTQAAGGQDEIVVVMRQDQLDAGYSDEVIDEFPDAVSDVENPSDIGQLVKDDFDDISVEFKSYSDLDE
jgi:hypothetical protein